MSKLLKVLAISGIACRVSYYGFSHVYFPETKVHGDVYIDLPTARNWYKDADATFYTNYIHIENEESDIYLSTGTQIIVYGEVQYE